MRCDDAKWRVLAQICRKFVVIVKNRKLLQILQSLLYFAFISATVESWNLGGTALHKIEKNLNSIEFSVTSRAVILSLGTVAEITGPVFNNHWAIKKWFYVMISTCSYIINQSVRHCVRLCVCLKIQELRSAPRTAPQLLKIQKVKASKVAINTTPFYFSGRPTQPLAKIYCL